MPKKPKRVELVLTVDPDCPYCKGCGTLPSGYGQVTDAHLLCECVQPRRLDADAIMVEGVRYVCGRCFVSGVKLWRFAQTFLENQRLFCVDCGEAEEGCTLDLARTDQLGNLVPAVPTDGTFWGYTSVPEEDARWWKALPLRAPTSS